MLSVARAASPDAAVAVASRVPAPSAGTQASSVVRADRRTGRLVRTMVVSAPGQTAAAPLAPGRVRADAKQPSSAARISDRNALRAIIQEAIG